MVKTTIMLWRIGKRNLNTSHEIITIESVGKLEEKQIKGIIEKEMGFEVLKCPDTDFTKNSFTDISGNIEIKYHEYIPMV